MVSAIRRALSAMAALSWQRLALMAVAVALAFGVAAAALSYLGDALKVPAPATRAGTAELRERGAAILTEFCGPLFEPLWWPECVGDAPEERERGADLLVAVCTQGGQSRMFSASDCLSEDRAPVALVGGPGWDDLAVGGLAAVVALVVLALVAGTSRATVPRRSA